MILEPGQHTFFPLHRAHRDVAIGQHLSSQQPGSAQQVLPQQCGLLFGQHFLRSTDSMSPGAAGSRW